MSGVYIKGMEMPKSCHACCFFGQADIWESDFDGYTKSFCTRTGSQTFDYVDKFLPNCPLVHVPDHGRLVDADRLDTRDRGNNSSRTMWQNIRWLLKNAPTIIPEDKEDTDGIA